MRKSLFISLSLLSIYSASAYSDNGVLQAESLFKKQYIYITNATVANENAGSVTLCKVTPRNGLLTNNCKLIGDHWFSYPHGIALSRTQNYAYVTNTYSGTVAKCSINATDGTFSACTDSGATGLAYPNGIVFDNNENYAYITNLYTNSVSVCKINNSTGALSCQNSNGDGFGFPHRIVLNPNNTRAYITNEYYHPGQETYAISTCAIDAATGQFSNCHTAGGEELQEPSGMAFTADGKYIYITNEITNNVSICAIDASTGSFVENSCQDAGADLLNFPEDIVLNAAGTHAYISNSARDYVLPSSLTECSIDASTHLLSNCHKYQKDFNHASGIALSNIK